MKIDPIRFTNFNRTAVELEAMLLFSMAVAGKTARTIAPKIEELIGEEQEPIRFLKGLQEKGKLRTELEKVKVGNYTKFEKFVKTFPESLNLCLCSLEDLEAIHGIGSKTARMFLLHSRPNQKYAVLDTHILKFMGEVLEIEVPKSTPSRKKYLELEKKLLALAESSKEIKFSKGFVKIKRNKSGEVNFADFDLDLWVIYSTRSGGNYGGQ